MRLDLRFVLLTAACFALAACNSGGNTKAAGNEPTGQVVATVNGQEITLLELKSELGDRPLPTDPKAAKAAEQGALRALIGKKVIANAAREQGLDRTPDFALQQIRAMDALLMQTLQAKIAKEMPPPAPEEVDRYIAQHRDIFAERKIFVVDQISMARPTDPQKLKILEPLKTLPDVESALKQGQIEYKILTNGVIDAVGASPELIDRITKLPPKEVFILPNGDGLLVNQIREVRIVPFIGEIARSYALAMIRNQRLQETTQRQFNAILAKSQSSIRYNKAYAPEPAPATQPSDTKEGGAAAPAPAQLPDVTQNKSG